MGVSAEFNDLQRAKTCRILVFLANLDYRRIKLDSQRYQVKSGKIKSPCGYIRFDSLRKSFRVASSSVLTILVLITIFTGKLRIE